ncbi:MAG: hypothetical protein WA705_28920 [Candidatus Ozemobacteraceae bacterium]
METISYLRQFRLSGYAVFDFAAAFLGIFLFSPFLSKLFRKIGLEIPKLSWVYFTLPMSVLTHLIIGNITPLTKNFIDLYDHYLLKIVIIGLSVLGLRKIRRVSGTPGSPKLRVE